MSRSRTVRFGRPTLVDSRAARPSPRHFLYDIMIAATTPSPWNQGNPGRTPPAMQSLGPAALSPLAPFTDHLPPTEKLINKPSDAVDQVHTPARDCQDDAESHQCADRSRSQWAPVSPQTVVFTG